MKLVKPCPNIIHSIRSELKSSFTLIDVGCAFGIDPPFQDFGETLTAYGFEPNLDECQRLIKENQNPNIHYVPAFVKLDPNHPFAVAKAGKSHWSDNPWSHLAVARSLESARSKQLSSEEKAAMNLWSDTKLADQTADVDLDEFLPKHGIVSIDLCKIDVDGTDFEIMHSLERFFSGKNVLAVVVEVNFFGSDNDTDHTFHNVDRFMRGYGFDLFGLTVNKYSAKSLPAPYLFSGPGENLAGRPYQGDALYVINAFSEPPAIQLTRDGLLKLVAIFALFELPDWAAEILVTYGSKHLESDKITEILELLARQIQEGRSLKLGYGAYLAAFDDNDPYFYAPHSTGGNSNQGGSMVDELAQLRSDLAQLRQSKSWKITAPLRSISQFLKRGGCFMRGC